MYHQKRRAKVLANGIIAGTLTEYEHNNKMKFVYQYEFDYIKNGAPIGYHFPLTRQPYEFDEFPIFFENLASEGWLKKLQCEKNGIDEKDIFGLLLANGKELIGALSIIEDTSIQEKFSDSTTG
jgi:serine/threonine-protein kinase HipA